MTRKRNRRDFLRASAVRRVSALAAAKVNIGLYVGRPRSDGYHDVCGLVQTVSLADRVDVSLDPTGEGANVGRGVHLSVPDARELEVADNLVARAAGVLVEGRDVPPVWIRIGKAIPVAAGLGGGSADAAAALAALNVVWGLGLDATRLVDLAAHVSSDVPALLAGGLVHISGRGERIRGVGAATAGAFVLGISEERISATDAYAAFDAVPGGRSDAFHHNDLEAAAVRLVPALVSRLAAMRGAGGHPVFVSGSGPTVVGVAGSREDAADIAERARDSFARVETVTPTTWGVRLRIGGEVPLIH